MAFQKNVLDRARERMYKKGIDYAGKGSGLYNTFRNFYLLSIIYASFWSFIIILTPLIFISEMEVINGHFVFGEKGIPIINYVPITAGTIISLLSFVALKFNDRLWVAITFGCVNYASLITVILVTKHYWPNDIVSGSEPAKYYYCCLVPLIITLLCVLGMVAVVVKAHLKTKKEYKKVLELLYEEYNALPDDSKPDWEEFVQSYEF